ncbi:ornithine carbamoyltransferase [Campylobacter fetus]|uniref:ornithine carbamoyltransferase n=1 Tax=Campylobacter fetus TaxID=196 RepID=UPI001281D4BF|nr:ornithine carbamoyltransferase [Campylobacter fetus]EAI5647271.1 ornithine carbamoyltransferase [Campylobacter fetus]EAI5944865.1 ornithine carbamoyltransferase [Campylobacter fetus]EAJ0319315.1 ornithine carbamoyltransferase [Campylobacter fetus]EAJ0344863.1 ornithine carbamoyltransferase [Campylobacter fetus]EAJ1238637.1 ornithine carbamoyltransferase [Campylobacter fetus]
MKISIECDCVLLAQSLRLFLDGYYAPKKECDFIISDKKTVSDKPVFIISEKSPYLSVPFTKDTLLNTLEEFYSAMQIRNQNYVKKSPSSLEERVSNLVDNFKCDLINIIKDEYEK